MLSDKPMVPRDNLAFLATLSFFNCSLNCSVNNVAKDVERSYIMDSSSMSALDGMSGMQGMGMDMGSDGMFRPVNQMLARTYWYLVAAFFVLALLFKIAGAFESWSRSVSCRLLPSPIQWEARLICLLQVNEHPVRFPFHTPRDLEISLLKHTQRHSQSPERFPILK